MNKLIAVSLFIVPLAFAGSAEAGKFAGAGQNRNQPTSFSQNLLDCSGPQYHSLHNPCAPTGPTIGTSATGQPHGGCGYYGPNGVLIECK